MKFPWRTLPEGAGETGDGGSGFGFVSSRGMRWKPETRESRHRKLAEGPLRSGLGHRPWRLRWRKGAVPQNGLVFQSG